MTAIASPAPAGPGAAPDWRRLAWVSWRQHRLAVIGLAALGGGLAATMIASGLRARSILAAFALSRCAARASLACTQQAYQFWSPTRIGGPVLLAALPAVIGTFVAAPAAVARELESGTFRFTFTQAAGRFWAFQAAGAGCLLLAAGLLIAVTLRLVRRAG